MITTKQKWITIAVFLLVLLLSAGFGFFDAKASVMPEKITSVKELSGKAIGGVKAKMPDASAKIFFESQFGEKFSSYRSYETAQNAVNALKSNQIQALWASDVTAEWLVMQDDSLHILPETATATEDEVRMQFALAFRPQDEAMRALCNERLAQLKEDGKLEAMFDQYVRAVPKERLTPEQMTVNSKTFSLQITGKPVYIGITGAVPPLECIDEDAKPYGFCVALADQLGQCLGREVRFKQVDNETIFTELMSGKLDIVFCYGTSPNHSTEFPPYIMSDGYCPMEGYRLVVTK